ncbi:hypothetical protein LQZ19_07075 [Treponema primitia]|uniref:hypothetical protein n=1 Tax=Treponema primitia TaxID=88058 RepID=UPI003980ED24
MKNITLAIDEETLSQGREYAKRRNMSFNALVRDLLARTVKPASTGIFEEFFRIADEAHGNSNGWKWNRGELYDREICRRKNIR